MRKILLLLPCNSGAEKGDYMLGSNWKLIYGDLKDLVDEGAVDIAAVDCINNAGIVLRGEEYRVRGGNVYPSWERFKSNPQLLKDLTEAVASRLRELSPRYDGIVAYLNVRAYRLAVEMGARRAGVDVRIIDLPFNPLGYRSKKKRAELRRAIEGMLGD